MKQPSTFGVFFLLSSATVLVHGAPSPPRIFGNKNILRAQASQPLEQDIPEAELELESLKGHGKSDMTNSLIQPHPDEVHISEISTSTSSPVAAENVKKPENEEKPALSDNANSLKFGHQNMDGFDFSKKHHLNSNLQFQNTKDNKEEHHNKEIRQENNIDLGIRPHVQSPQYRDPSSLVGTSILSNDHQNLQLDYTPQDIAEYVFWTGDEHGVAMAIGDFLQEGLVDREDAVKFLEDVKRELNSIRGRYSATVSQGQQAALHNANFGLNAIQPSYNGGFPMYKSSDIRSSKRESYTSPEMTNPFPLIHSPEGNGFNSPSRGAGMALRQSQHDILNPSMLSSGSGIGIGNGGNNNLLSVEELDYDDIAEKLRTVDAKMREYSLEEVIYSLGKDLFSESLKNSPTDSIQKFSTFVETQVSSGRIPKDLEKDVLEALVGAFVDAVDEQGQGHGQIQVSRTYDGHINSNPHLNIPTNVKPTQAPVVVVKKNIS